MSGKGGGDEDDATLCSRCDETGASTGVSVSVESEVDHGRSGLGRPEMRSVVGEVGNGQVLEIGFGKLQSSYLPILRLLSKSQNYPWHGVLLVRVKMPPR